MFEYIAIISLASNLGLVALSHKNKNFLSNILLLKIGGLYFYLTVMLDFSGVFAAIILLIHLEACNTLLLSLWSQHLSYNIQLISVIMPLHYILSGYQLTFYIM